MTARTLPVFFTFLVIGCGQGNAGKEGATEGGPRYTAALVEMSAWVPGDPAFAPDPLPDHQPADPSCPIGASLMEGSAFEIRTATCTYGWFQQSALADLGPGDEVELVFWHNALISDPPATGHVALFVGDELLYERILDIPADPAAYTESVAVDFSSPVDAPVTLHVHNHGANDWNFLRLERMGEEAP